MYNLRACVSGEERVASGVFFWYWRGKVRDRGRVLMRWGGRHQTCV